MKSCIWKMPLARNRPKLMTGDANSSTKMLNLPISEPPMNRKSRPYQEKSKRWISESQISLSWTRAEQLETAGPWMRTPLSCRWRLWGNLQSTRLSATKTNWASSATYYKTRLFKPRTCWLDMKDLGVNLRPTTRNCWRKTNCSEWEFPNSKLTDRMKSLVWRTNSSSLTRPTPKTLEISPTTKWRCSLRKLRNWKESWRSRTRKSKLWSTRTRPKRLLMSSSSTCWGVTFANWKTD